MPLSREREKLLGRLRRRKSREREGLFLVEGVRGVTEALDGGADVVFAVIAPRAREVPGGDEVVARLRSAGSDVHVVEDPDLARLSATESPQGVLVVCREPRADLGDLDPRGGVLPTLRLLLVDGVQDPGNLGTLLRAAAAFDLRGVVVLEGTVDPYNAKAVRAAAGALFRLTVVSAPWHRVREWLGERNVRVLVADAAGDDVASVRPAPPWALVVGSEAGGVRKEVSGEASAVVAVPMPGGTESLNAGVAGAILLYALTREAVVA